MTEPAPAAVPFAPLPEAERIDALDALRGFALLGIALMNIEFFSRPLQGMQLGLDPALAGIDYAAAWLIAAFVQGKFWALFSLLFGMGFAVMAERADGGRVAPDFNRIYARRLVVLLLFGLLHATLLWAGDILVPYALVGFVLLLMARSMQPPDLWKVGLAAYFAPMLLLWMATALIALSQLDPAAAKQVVAEIGKAGSELRAAYADAEIAYRDGSYADVTRRRVADTLMQLEILWMFLPQALGMFLLGAWFIRTGAMRETRAHARLFRRLAWIGGALGVVLAVVSMRLTFGHDLLLPTPAVALGITLMHAASLLLCLAYAGALVLALDGRGAALGRWLAPAGRMALTNYLLQSLLFGTLFYGYGAGLWGQVPRAAQVVLVVAVYGAQLLLSRAWLAHFRFGPVEWLWRALTYGHAPVMRARRAVGPAAPLP